MPRLTVGDFPAAARSVLLSPMLLFAALAAAPFFWGAADTAFRYMGADDYLSPIDIAASFHYAAYPYDLLNGAGFDQAFIVAMLPVYFYYYVLDAAGITPLLSIVLMMALVTFAAQASFFASMRYFLQRRLGVQGATGACALGAVFYGFSPYVIAQVLPGHCVTLFLYAFFPLVVRYLDELLVAARPSPSAMLGLFVIFAASSPTLANIGTLYVMLIAAGLYALSLMLTQRLGFWRTGVRLAIFTVLPFVANAWWIASHFYNLQRYIAHSATHGGEMVNLVAWASKDASIANVLLGRPETTVYMVDILGHGHYINALQGGVFLALSALAFWAAFARNRHVYAMLLTALATLMFMKGVQPPFSDLFLWAYDNIPGFQVMRRPTAKMYGIFLFFFLACATFGMAFAATRLAARPRSLRLLHAGLGLAAAYAVVIFASSNSMKPFNIPRMYYEARDYLMAERVERALILPAISGVRPVYRPAMNSYSGMDFVHELWRFPKIAPNTFDLSSDAGHLQPTKELLQLVRDNHAICASTRALGLSHLVVRDDMAPSVEEYPGRLLAATLDRHPDVVPGRKFTDGAGSQLSVYRLKPQCAGRLIDLRGNYKAVRYEVVNPGAIVLEVDGLSGPAELTFLVNYNENWELFAEPWHGAGGVRPGPGIITAAYNAPEAMRMGFGEARFLFEAPVFKATHRPLGYANAWTLDRLPSADASAASDAGNLRLILFYRPQGILLSGVMLSLLTLLALAVLASALRRRVRHHAPARAHGEAA